MSRNSGSYLIYHTAQLTFNAPCLQMIFFNIFLCKTKNEERKFFVPLCSQSTTLTAVYHSTLYYRHCIYFVTTTKVDTKIFLHLCLTYLYTNINEYFRKKFHKTYSCLHSFLLGLWPFKYLQTLLFEEQAECSTISAPQHIPELLSSLLNQKVLWGPDRPNLPFHGS